MFKKLSLSSLLIISAYSLPVTASAQMVCGDRGEVIKQLERDYGETRKAVGLQQGRGVVEIYASKNTGSWTILVTDTRGKSCIMAVGEAFQVDNHEIEGENS